MTSALVLAVLIAAVFVRRDWRNWLALGKGGLPHTAAGYLALSAMRWRIWRSGRDPRDPADVVNDLADAADAAHLAALAPRADPRPRIAPHPVPHRQLDQFAGTAMRTRLQELFDSQVSAKGGKVEYRKSFFEKHNPAITLCDCSRGHAHARISHGEIAHIHPSDGSMHMILSPSDAKSVLATGWGELHPLCGTDKDFIATYAFVYPPRDETELDAVRQILAASVEHMLAGRAENPDT